MSSAVICVPLAKRMGLSSVLGYLLAGILIGPYVLGFVGQEGQDIMHIAEFGVVMMLFLIGLELDPLKFWRMRHLIVGLGGLQVLITMLAVLGIAMAIGFEWRAALSLGMIISLSSTAIVLQTLKEKGLISTSAGQSSFSVLLFQDIAVIPMLAVMPLLATSLPQVAVTHDVHHANVMEDLPAWLQTTLIFASIFLIVIVGKYVIVPMLRIISKTRLRELFTGASLLIVVGISYLMELVGLSHALGAFLGGVVLANSEFKHEMESDLEPFKGLLLGLFFIGVGASIDFHTIARFPITITAIVLGIAVVKIIILLALGFLFRLKFDQNLTFAFGLSQVGEFAFVLLSFANQVHIFSPDWINKLMAVTAISMTVSPLFILVVDKLILPVFGTKEKVKSTHDTISHDNNKVIIAGFSHYGSTIGRFLRAHGVEATVLDNDSDRVDLLRKMGFKVYYGDATRSDLLEAAGAQQAQILVSTIGDAQVNKMLLDTVRTHFPHLKLFIRVKDRFVAYDFLEVGVDAVYRQALESSVRMGVDILHELGFRSYTLNRAAANFIKYDEASMRKLVKNRKNAKQYVTEVRAEIAEQEKLLSVDYKKILYSDDISWDSEHMREVVTGKKDITQK